MTADRAEANRRALALHNAYRRGDMTALRQALGDPPDFPNCRLRVDLAVGEFPLGYAIYWSPLPFIDALLAAGANPNFPDAAGFPSLIAALSTDRPDKHAVLTLLLARGADVGQRGNNDWTPLHYAVARRDLAAIEVLLAHGADPAAPTRIDERSTPLQDAEIAGFAEAVAAMRGSRG